MKSSVKRIIFVIIILIILFSINTKVSAWSGIIDSAKGFIRDGDSQTSQVTDYEVRKTSSYIYNMLLVAGIVISVIIASILGIQFMLGGAEGQAKVKEMLVPYIIGCIVVFGGFGFWKIALKIGKSLETATYISDTKIEMLASMNYEEKQKLY